MTMRVYGFCVSTLLLLAACSTPDYEAEYDEQAPQADVGEVVFENTEFGDLSTPPASAAQETRIPRKLVKNGAIAIEVNDVDAAAQRAAALTLELGGYVSEETSNDYGSAHRQLTLKLPAARFDDALPRLEALAARVISRDIHVEDKTAEYVDIAARLQTQRALAARLRQLVAKATEVKDVIEVERELARVTADIEAFEARLKSIDRDATYATLRLSIEGPSEPALATTFLQDLGESLSFGVDFLRAATLGIVALWPLWLVVVPLVVWWRRTRRRRATGPLSS